MYSPGGFFNATKATGLGLLTYHAYMPNLSTFYCPMQTSCMISTRQATRPLLKGYNNLAAFRNAIDHHQVDVMLHYVYRGQRWARAGEHPALTDTSLGLLDRYLYSFERGPLGKYSGVSLIADGFTQQSGGDINDIDLFHRDGLNVAYSDGHVGYVVDAGQQIHNLPSTWGGGILDMRNISEDVWDALDGDIGYQVYALVRNLR